jgi:hypothetical protein
MLKIKMTHMEQIFFIPQKTDGLQNSAKKG